MNDILIDIFNCFLDFNLKISLFEVSFFVLFLLVDVLLVIPNKKKKKGWFINNKYAILAFKSSLIAIPLQYLLFRLIDFYFANNSKFLFLIAHDYVSILTVALHLVILYYLLIFAVVIIFKKLDLDLPFLKQRKVINLLYFFVAIIPFIIGVTINYPNFTFVTRDHITFPYLSTKFNIIWSQKTYLISDIHEIKFQPNAYQKIQSGRLINVYKVYDSYKITFKDGTFFDSQNLSSPYLKYNLHSSKHELVNKKRLKNREYNYEMFKLLSDKNGLLILNENDIFTESPYPEVSKFLKFSTPGYPWKY